MPQDPVDKQKTCVCYCRTSTRGQQESETIAAQVERCTRLVERHNLRLVPYGASGDGWIKDDGVTGTLLEGRQFSAFIDDLKAGRVAVDYVVLFSLSRVARVDKVSKDIEKLIASHQAAALIRSVLIGRNVWLLDEDGPMDPRTVAFEVKAMLANEEFKLIRERTMAGKARRLDQGRFAKGGKPPYGYRQVFANGKDRKDGFLLQVDPERAANLKRLFGWFCEGGVTSAARRATEAGIPTPMAFTDNRKN